MRVALWSGLFIEYNYKHKVVNRRGVSYEKVTC
jgi:hypothetical protein